MIVGTILHPAALWQHGASQDPVRFAMIGWIIGFLAWRVHKLILRRAEDYLKQRFGIGLSEDDTTELRRSDISGQSRPEEKKEQP